MRFLDLFSGIGGFALGLERAGWEVAGFCEIEPFPRAVLKKHWPNIWLHDDIRTLSAELVLRHCGAVDAIVGGFPCQDISLAGKGAGIEGARSGLWSEMFRLVRELQPRWLLVENVPALRTRGADWVLAHLEGGGYTCWPLVVGAWAVGAPHRRDRVWIVAHSGQSRLEGIRPRTSSAGAQYSGPASGGGACWPSRPGERQYEWEECRLTERGKSRQIEPAMGGAVDGISERLVRRGNGRWRREAIKALGNSVVPQIVEQVGRSILQIDANQT